MLGGPGSSELQLSFLFLSLIFLLTFPYQYAYVSECVCVCGGEAEDNCGRQFSLYHTGPGNETQVIRLSLQSHQLAWPPFPYTIQATRKPAGDERERPESRRRV